MSPDDLQRRLLYRDGMMLVFDKPAGLAVHAAGKGEPTLDASFDALRFGLPGPPALAHRLDRDTAGCLVLGRHRKALARLGALFAGGGVAKTYWAVVEGVPPSDHGRIELALTKRTGRRDSRVVVDAAGKAAVTDYRVLGRADDIAWLELTPHTGRTHQIRVHCAAIGCPILGDPLYAENPVRPEAVRLHLLSRAISIPLYPKRPPVTVTAEPPAHMHAALRRCGWVRPEPPDLARSA